MIAPTPKNKLLKISKIAGLAVSITGCAISSFAEDDLLATFTNDIEPILDQYCYDCHGYGSDKGGVVLDGFADAGALQDHELWLRALKNMRSNIMPPEDETQPSDEEKATISNWIRDRVFVLNAENPDPGRMTVRRLNRVEYRNTIKDLLNVDYDTSSEFPADDTGHGFDNMGDVLTISPMLLEKYLDAAQAIVSEAVPTQPLVVAENKIPGKQFAPSEEISDEEDSWVHRMPYYKAATATTTHTVEVTGDYQLVLDLMAIETYVDNQFDYNECQFIFKVDGETVLDRKFIREGYRGFEFVYDRRWEAGEHELTFELIPLTPDQPEVRNLRMQINNVVVRGPMSDEHWVKPENYAKFFPEPVPNGQKKKEAYARELLSDFAYKAFRRPVDEGTIDRLVSLALRVGEQKDSTFETGIAQAMGAVLASPRFLFREESTEPLERGQTNPYIDEYALASRLSYFLWTTMPDPELIGLAEKGELRANLSEQVTRMLKDPRSKGFVNNFTGQWLQARDIEGVAISSFAIWLRENPNPELNEARQTFRRLREIEREDRTEEEQAELDAARAIFFASFRAEKPELGRDVRKAMRLESELVFEHILQNDRSVLELIDSDYTFLNEELAKHYGIEGVEGDNMRKVKLSEDSPRGGVLTQGTVLAVTSNPSRTSPVKRGVFILDNILGTPPAPPPPNIPALEDVASEEELAEMSLRETLALHASKRLCRSCHLRMDPLGLALENFNAMGIWRDREMGKDIEPEGRLITGEEFNNIRELKNIIATERRNDFYHCISEKVMTYALGRGMEYYDTDTLDHLVDTLHKTDGRLSALIVEIINSAAFQKQRAVDPETIVELEESAPENLDTNS